jgi:sigma-E factor negative regulatory protein RseA
MKQQISTLMDGELFDDEAETLLGQMKKEGEVCEAWLTYHLISDAMRQPDHLHADISSKLRERLQAEPTVLAPHSWRTQKTRWFALSAAASVLAVGVVAWLSVQVGPEPAAQMASNQQQQPSAVRPASFSPNQNNDVNDYLMAHQEFSPSADVQGAASYIHTVAGR